MIIYDQQNSRTLDTENGDYLLSQIRDRKEQWAFSLYDRHDQLLFGSIVEVRDIVDLSDTGKTTRSRCTLLACWVTPWQGEQPVYFYGDHPLIPRLATFLKAQLYHQQTKQTHWSFEFIDSRDVDRQAAAFVYRQNKSEPKQSTVKGIDVLFGLFLTLVLHCLQLSLRPLAEATGNDKFALALFFFGFTQLLYMFPAISYFKRLDKRGIVVGLMIGASLTFILGLPVAGIGYICATNPGARIVH